MEDLKEAMLEFMNIQNKRLEEQRRLEQERSEKQNERFKKMSKLLVLKKEQGNTNSFSQDLLINSAVHS